MTKLKINKKGDGMISDNLIKILSWVLFSLMGIGILGFVLRKILN